MTLSYLSLRTKLILWFLLISLLPLGWMTYLFYESSRKMLVNQATENLKAVNLLQAQTIENYFREKERTAASLAQANILPKNIEILKNSLIRYGKDSPEYERGKQKYQSDLTLQTETLGYQNILLISKDGYVVFSTYPSKILGTNLLDTTFVNNQLKDIFINARNLLETQISNFIYYDPTEPPASFIAVPLLTNGHLIGVIIAQIDNSFIYEFITNHTGLGKTGETILVTTVDHELMIQSPLRHEQEAIFTQQVSPQSSFGQFIKQILDGNRIVKNVIDYRGEETLMIGRYLLPSLHWGIITKIDMKELLAPVQELRTLAWILSLAMTGLVILTALRVAYTITRPLLIMTKKTRQMAAGDLSQHVDIQGNDEIARLGYSFNNMADQLNNMIQNLDVIVAKRTEEVEQQNTKLERTIEELQQAQNRLITQEKLASLGALTAGIAHEIKNPLNFINNFAELSLQIDQDMEARIEKIKTQINPKEAELLHDYLETLKLNIGKIYEHGKRADSIVRNMLQHSRGTSGDMVLTDINALLDEYIALSYHGMRAQTPSFNVKIEKNYDYHLPKIYVVPQEISRVFLNLLNNAYYSVHQKQKHFPQYQPVVKVSTYHQKHFVIISIWDNGEGISKEIFPKLFTPFFTTKPAGEGTGLGLSLSYNIIVQGHQGSLVADSVANEFAEFTITIPVFEKRTLT